MRNLMFTRKKNINGCAVPYQIVIDGSARGEVENGKTEVIPIDNNRHTVCVCAPLGDRNYWSKTMEIYSGSNDYSFEVITKTGLIKVGIYLNQI